MYLGCQPDEPLASLVTTNRVINVYGFLVVIMLLMYSVLIVCILLGIKLLLLLSAKNWNNQFQSKYNTSVVRYHYNMANKTLYYIQYSSQFNINQRLNSQKSLHNPWRQAIWCLLCGLGRKNYHIMMALYSMWIYYELYCTVWSPGSTWSPACKTLLHWHNALAVSCL